MNAMPPNGLKPTAAIPSSSEEQEFVASYRGYLWVGSVAVLGLVVGLGGWAVMAEISGAVIAPGVVAVEGKTKAVQHLTGGIIGEIDVREGDVVEPGRLLVRLDDAQLRTRLAAVGHRLAEAEAQIARLAAERDGSEFIPPPIPDDFVAPLEARSIIDGQRTLLEAGRTKRSGEVEQLRRQIDQMQQTIVGTKGIREAKLQQLDLGQQELDAVSQLAKKGYAAKKQVLALEREVVRLKGEIAEHDSEILRSSHEIEEAEVKIEQIDRDYREQLLTDLSRAAADRSQAREDRSALVDELERTEVRAPLAGVVHELAVHTIGGVIAAGEPILTIVPLGLPMIIEARVPLDRIDEVRVGQAATVRLSAFDRRTTPELDAIVTEVSADRVSDRAGTESWYPVIVTISESELQQHLDGLNLVSGMPAEVFVTTAGRTPMNYLLKPLLDQFNRAARE